MAEQDTEFDVETGEEVKSQTVNDTEADDEDTSTDTDSSTQTDHDDDDGGDSQANDGDTDDEREAIRERRRQERKHRKEAQREREDTLRRELASRDAVINELRSKVDVIERRNTGSEVAQIENGKKQAAQAYNFFKDQIRVAGEAGNHAAVADATEKMIQAQRRFDELTRVEQVFKQRQAAPQPLDPRLANHAQVWMEKNSWYDPSGQDQDSEIAMRIDQRLAQEGWDPTTKEYWDELSARVKKYLPHRVNRDKIGSARPKSVVTGGEREMRSQNSAKTYKLSSERVTALKEAGLWDDPKKRADAIKRFQAYDKQNQG